MQTRRRSSAARALQEEDWEDTDEAVSEAWEACGFQTLREGRLCVLFTVQVKEDEDSTEQFPGSLPEVQSGFFARARQESGRPLEVDVGLVGDGTLSSAA